MAIYDVESLVNDLETILKADLNTKIAAINTEKNDTISLATINDSAWFLQSLSGAEVNYSPFILYGISGFEEDEVGNFGYTSSRVNIQIVIVLSDDGQDLQIVKRMLRYQRALKEVIEDNFDQLQTRAKMSVQNQVPVDLELLNGSYSHKAIGVTVKVDLG